MKLGTLDSLYDFSLGLVDGLRDQADTFTTFGAIYQYLSSKLFYVRVIRLLILIFASRLFFRSQAPQHPTMRAPVVTVLFATSSISQCAAELFAYGTAVQVE